MTIRQKAYTLIDGLPDESVTMLVNLMMLLPKKDALADNIKPETLSEKQLAFRRMQELREISKSYNLGSFEEEIDAAIAEKYGRI